MTLSRPKIGEVFVRWGRATQGDIDRALDTSLRTRRRIGEVLIEMEIVSETDVAQALAEQLGLPYLDLTHTYMVNPESLSMMPYGLMRKLNVVPLGKAGSKVRVLVHDPVNVTLIDDLRYHLNAGIDVFVGTRSQIRRFIEAMPQGVQAGS